MSSRRLTHIVASLCVPWELKRVRCTEDGMIETEKIMGAGIARVPDHMIRRISADEFQPLRPSRRRDLGGEAEEIVGQLPQVAAQPESSRRLTGKVPLLVLGSDPTLSDPRKHIIVRKGELDIVGGKGEPLWPPEQPISDGNKRYVGGKSEGGRCERTRRMWRRLSLGRGDVVPHATEEWGGLRGRRKRRRPRPWAVAAWSTALARASLDSALSSPSRP